MGLKRTVRLGEALRYRGQGPMLAFLLHRIGGVSMVVFVGLHMVASFVGGDFGRFVNGVYQHWLFQAYIYFCALFHAINGLRIVIMDLWPKLLEHQREAIWLEWAVFLPIYALSVFWLARIGLGG
ncbi:MAG: hypothetical protein N2049_02040 [Anaerolineales bacterium]|nr:hypothetical protein [Anaerolineales bacterium]MCX7607987.1 hypothetical protein [Anaerolineales bacterium]MDW8226666.1 hypothetical protein [Anaerolineales bacterium]